MKSKKLLLGSLSAMALVATPIATVVSCGKDTPAAAKITKSNAKGFVINDGDSKFFIPAAIAKKAGSINFAKVKYSWTKEMEAGKTLKATSLRKDEGSSSTPKDVKISKSDAEHFVLPVKGLTGGVGLYVDREYAKYWVGQLLTMKKLDFNLPTATKDGKTIVTKDGIIKLNDFLKVMDLTAKSVDLTLHEATANIPKYTTYKINWAKTGVKTVSEFKTQFDNLGIMGTATSVTANNTVGTKALADISAIQNAAGSGVTLTIQSGKPFSIPKGFTVTFKGITALNNKNTSTLTLTLTKLADKTTAEVNISIFVNATPTKTDAADVAAVKALLVTNAITPAVATDAVAAITTATPITDLASLNTATPNIVFSATGTLPTGAALKGVSIKIKSLSALAAAGSAHGNLVIELSKGQATDTITIAVVGKA